MADTKISALDAAGTLDGTELIPVVKDGLNKSATPSTIKTFAVGNGLTVRNASTVANPVSTLVFANGTVTDGGDGTATVSGLVANPMTTGGDVIYGGASGVPTRLANGSAGQVLTSGGTTVAPTWETPSASGSAVSLQQLRLYATTGVPVPASDTTTVNTIYVGPFNGNTVTLIDGSDNLVNHSLAEISLALSGLTSGKPYDVWLYSNAGTLTLELSAAWTNDTTRSDAVALVKGFIVKNADHTRLHVGTIYTTGTDSTTDTAAKRYIWNRFNQQRSTMFVAEATNTWVYTTATVRQANGSAANQLDYVTGDAGTVIEAALTAAAVGDTLGVTLLSGMGVDDTTAFAGVANHIVGRRAVPATVSVFQITSKYSGRPGLGRHRITWLEYSAATGSTTWWGDGGGANPHSGIAGTIQN